jgi:hypothetical protein
VGFDKGYPLYSRIKIKVKKVVEREKKKENVKTRGVIYIVSNILSLLYIYTYKLTFSI